MSACSGRRVWFFNDCVGLQVLRGIDLAADIGGGVFCGREEAAEERLKERVEDDLGALGHW